MLNAQTQYVTLDNGYSIWTRRVGHSPHKLMLIHDSAEMPWDYLTMWTDFARCHNIELIFVELLGSYLSDQPADMSILTPRERISEIKQVVDFYGLDHFAIHGITGSSTVARQYHADHPQVWRLLTDPGELASVWATEILGNFDSDSYQSLMLKRLHEALTV